MTDEIMSSRNPGLSQDQRESQQLELSVMDAHLEHWEEEGDSYGYVDFRDEGDLDFARVCGLLE